MKNIYIICLLLFFNMTFAQSKENPFSAAEGEAAEPYIEQLPTGTGPPGDDDLPIDHYVSFLLLTATGIISYTAWKKNKALS